MSLRASARPSFCSGAMNSNVPRTAPSDWVSAGEPAPPSLATVGATDTESLTLLSSTLLR